MTPAIDKLMNEHALILDVLSSLESCVLCTVAGEPLPRSTLADYCDFIVRFADKYHHAKEENILFLEMQKNGFRREEGPLSVMLAEHDEGRQYAGVMRKTGQGEGNLTPEEVSQWREAAESYVQLLRNHIAKEDSVLYPMAMRFLPPDSVEQLEQQCSQVDEDFREQVTTLKAKANILLTRYPPHLELEDSSCESGCHGCHNMFCSQR